MVDRVDPRTGELVTTNYGWTKPTVGASADAWGGYLNTDLDGIDSTVFGMLPKAGGTMTGAIVLPGNAASALQAVPLQQLTSVTGGYLPLTGGILTGALTPSQTAGIVGTTTNNNAAAGAVGEFISANVVTGSAVPLTTNTGAVVASISLTAGDWDVRGIVNFNPAGTTVSTAFLAGVSNSSAFTSTWPNGDYSAVTPTANNAGIASKVAIPTYRYSLAATGTIYLMAQSSFITSTMAAWGWITARRVR